MYLHHVQNEHNVVIKGCKYCCCDNINACRVEVSTLANQCNPECDTWLMVYLEPCIACAETQCSVSMKVEPFEGSSNNEHLFQFSSKILPKEVSHLLEK